jgi:hypothetical protein
MYRIAFVVTALAALVACEDTTVGCDDMAVSSVSLTVEDADGNAITGANATYTVDGGVPSACEEFGDGNYACGYEQAGEITVTASAAGYAEASATVTVEADECHVITEQVTLTLDVADCTDVELPSMLVTVVGSSGEALSNAWAAYTPAGAEDPNDCYPTSTADVWQCGTEEAGTFTVAAGADGHETESVEVTVEADECHVITEEVLFELSWLPD